jgi:ribosome maturation factor RimP
MDLNLIKNILEPVINDHGYELYSLTTRKEGKDLILDVVVDRVKEIDMDAIVEITNVINEVLDEKDPIQEEYMLSVSSLGAEKPLKIEDLHLYVNSYINIHLKNPINGENIYEGTITKIENDVLTLSYRVKTRTKEIEVSFENIYKVRLAIKF